MPFKPMGLMIFGGHKKHILVLCVSCLVVSASCSADETGSADQLPPLESVLTSDDADAISGEVPNEEPNGMSKWAEDQDDLVLCMRSEGFSYFPVRPGPAPEVFAFTDGDPQWGTREWVEKNGFWLTTLLFPQEVVGEGLVGATSGLGDGEDPAAMTDRNEEYMITLSDAEFDAYISALEHCNEMVAPGLSLIDAAHKEFQDELDQLYARAESDSRLIAFEDRVASCLSREGYGLFTAADYANYGPWLEDLDLIDQELAGLLLDDDPGQRLQLSAGSRGLLGEIQAEEIAWALATFDCGGGDKQRQDLIGEIISELEESFVAEHYDELVELRDRDRAE